MRGTLILLCGMAAGMADAAGPNTPLVVDFNASIAPMVQAYQANAKAFDVSLKNGNSPVVLTGYTPFLWYAVSNKSTAISTAACAIVSATGGTFTASFSPAGLNTNGMFWYGVGITAGTGATTARPTAWP